MSTDAKSDVNTNDRAPMSDAEMRAAVENANPDDGTTKLVEVTDVHTGEPCGDPEFVAAVSKALHKVTGVEHDVALAPKAEDGQGGDLDPATAKRALDFNEVVAAAADEERKKGGPDPEALAAALTKLKHAITEDCFDTDTDNNKPHAMNIAGDFEVTALHTAAGGGAKEVLALLLGYKPHLTKPDLSKKNCFGQTPLMRLCKYYGDGPNLKACVELILDACVGHAVPDPTLPFSLDELAKMRADGEPVHEKLRVAYKNGEGAAEKRPAAAVVVHNDDDGAPEKRQKA